VKLTPGVGIVPVLSGFFDPIHEPEHIGVDACVVNILKKNGLRFIR